MKSRIPGYYFSLLFCFSLVPVQIFAQRPVPEISVVRVEHGFYQYNLVPSDTSGISFRWYVNNDTLTEKIPEISFGVPGVFYYTVEISGLTDSVVILSGYVESRTICIAVTRDFDCDFFIDWKDSSVLMKIFSYGSAALIIVEMYDAFGISKGEVFRGIHLEGELLHRIPVKDFVAEPSVCYFKIIAEEFLVSNKCIFSRGL